jgi:hypothetical protein
VSDERKLDSVERLVQEVLTAIFGKRSFSARHCDTVRIALTEMWDLSRREALREAEWILTVDRLPDANQIVWAFYPEIGVRSCVFRTNFRTWHNANIGALMDVFTVADSLGYYTPNKITHWKPRHIPAPPERLDVEEDATCWR